MVGTQFAPIQDLYWLEMTCEWRGAQNWGSYLQTTMQSFKILSVSLDDVIVFRRQYIALRMLQVF